MKSLLKSCAFWTKNHLGRMSRTSICAHHWQGVEEKISFSLLIFNLPVEQKSFKSGNYLCFKKGSTACAACQVPIPGPMLCLLLQPRPKGTDRPQVQTLSKNFHYTELLLSPQSLPLPCLLLSEVFLKDLKRYRHFPLRETFGNFK